jgi:hypothetical protein
LLLTSFTTVHLCRSQLLTASAPAVPSGQPTGPADSTEVVALQRYQQKSVCYEYETDYWRDTVEQCKDGCQPLRTDGQDTNGTEGRWVEGSYSCMIDGDWLDSSSGAPSDKPSKVIVPRLSTVY